MQPNITNGTFVDFYLRIIYFLSGSLACSLYVLQVCLKMRTAQMCRTLLRQPLSWTWISLATSPAGSTIEPAVGLVSNKLPQDGKI